MVFICDDGFPEDSMETWILMFFFFFFLLAFVDLLN
jgi:hypothetical protein